MLRKWRHGTADERRPLLRDLPRGARVAPARRHDVRRQRDGGHVRAPREDAPAPAVRPLPARASGPTTRASSSSTSTSCCSAARCPSSSASGCPCRASASRRPDAFLNIEVSRLHAKVIRRVAGDGPELPARRHALDLRHLPERRCDPGARRPRRRLRGGLRATAALGRLLLARARRPSTCSCSSRSRRARARVVPGAVGAEALPRPGEIVTVRREFPGRPQGPPLRCARRAGQSSGSIASETQTVGAATERARTSSSTSNGGGHDRHASRSRPRCPSCAAAGGRCGARPRAALVGARRWRTVGPMSERSPSGPRAVVEELGPVARAS